MVRADSSGTSFVFSQHLSAISDDFNKSVGANTMPNWAAGTKSKGNEGVTASVMTTPGSIGYIEFGYARSQKVPMAVLENKSGKYLAASTASSAKIGTRARTASAIASLVRESISNCLPFTSSTMRE